MSKSSKSWLPKRSAKSGQFIVLDVANRDGRKGVVSEGRGGDNWQGSSGLISYRSSVSGRIDLPNGHSITTVRKDIMDRALRRGEFEKK